MNWWLKTMASEWTSRTLWLVLIKTSQSVLLVHSDAIVFNHQFTDTGSSERHNHSFSPCIEAILYQLFEHTSRSFNDFTSGNTIGERIAHLPQKQALGCEQESCLAELGGALGVPLLISSGTPKAPPSSAKQLSCSQPKACFCGK